ncbi:MAG TPA: hypothetical protein VN047_06110 [Sphingopyxis sp.]|nr:hypothetical protein [Sphingopyxis sp.]
MSEPPAASASAIIDVECFEFLARDRRNRFRQFLDAGSGCSDRIDELGIADGLLAFFRDMGRPEGLRLCARLLAGRHRCFCDRGAGERRAEAGVFFFEKTVPFLQFFDGLRLGRRGGDYRRQQAEALQYARADCCRMRARRRGPREPMFGWSWIFPVVRGWERTACAPPRDPERRA